MTGCTRTEVEEFGRMIVEHLGLVFEEQKLLDLAATLNERLIATGSSGFEDYRARLCHSHEEWRTLAERLTIGETYFFRNPDQFRAFLELALPLLRRMIGGGREIRIMSAGCASGEEPYTLAILLRDLEKADPGLSRSLRAIDVNPASVKRAREARYSRWSLRQMPPGYCERFFRPDGQHFMLDPQVRAAAGFAE